MAKRECEFCRMYKRLQEFEKNHYEADYQPRYYACLYHTYYDKEYKQERGFSRYGRVRLHYCPYCGKKLR